MKVLILGIEGYLGWPLAMWLTERGHTVSGVDNSFRRNEVKNSGAQSATPIPRMNKRLKRFTELTGKEIKFTRGDVSERWFSKHMIKKYMPDCIVHLAEIPAAPFSMIDLEHCNLTQKNNILGTNNVLWGMKKFVPKCHLLKLGTMGEYGTPDMIIPEAAVSEFPRSPGSFYHASKVADSVNVEFACKVWGLSSTDIMQGVVHGVKTPQMVDDGLLTRFDFDEVWGTAINRFCAQAVVNHPITPYGKGEQTRGYLALRDSMQCLTIAVENPPSRGEYRVFNQLDECYTVNELAEHVKNVSQELGLSPNIQNVDNPRIESENHFYKPDAQKLQVLGFKPTNSLEDELRITLPVLMKYKKRIEEKRDKIMPTVKWAR